MERTELTKHGVTLTINAEKTNESKVCALEAQLGRSLPSDYREFLLCHNGGRPRERAFRCALRNGKPSDSVVDWFLSLHDEKGTNLESDLALLKDRIPPALLPIADDPFGNVVLLGLDGEARGKVYFWDHEEEPDSQPDWSNIDLVAESFDSFMRSLSPS